MWLWAAWVNLRRRKVCRETSCECCWLGLCTWCRRSSFWERPSAENSISVNTVNMPRLWDTASLLCPAVCSALNAPGSCWTPVDSAGWQTALSRNLRPANARFCHCLECGKSPEFQIQTDPPQSLWCGKLKHKGWQSGAWISKINFHFKLII